MRAPSYLDALLLVISMQFLPLASVLFLRDKIASMCLQQGDGCVGYLAVGVSLASGCRDSAMGTSQLHVELFPKQ